MTSERPLRIPALNGQALPLLSPRSSTAGSPVSVSTDPSLSLLPSRTRSDWTQSHLHCYSPSLEPQSTGDWISDLELMHHYSTITFATFPASQGALDLFRLELPRVALSHPYLMHQILAVSALHLADLRPGSRHAFLLRASRHQNLSLSGMRTALSDDITEQNCDALFATSAILMASTFASHRYTPNSSSFSPLDNMLEIFTLIRGMGLILKMSGDNLVKGSSRHLFIQDAPATRPARLLRSVTDRLSNLGIQINAAANIGQTVKRVAGEAISALIECIDRVPPERRAMVSIELRTIFLWPLILSTDFLGLLRAHEPAAMAIFIHYCVVLRRMEPDTWFLRGWSSMLAEYVYGVLSDTPWAEATRWALGQIREGTEPLSEVARDGE